MAETRTETSLYIKKSDIHLAGIWQTQLVLDYAAKYAHQMNTINGNFRSV